MKTLILSCVLLFVNTVCAQTFYDILDHKNTSVRISNEGTVFSDLDNDLLGYEVPKGSGFHAIYSTQFWFAAKDSLGNIKTAFGGYPQQGYDVFQGPYSYNYDAAYDAKWGDGVWTICQLQIDQFVMWWKCENSLADPADC